MGLSRSGAWAAAKALDLDQAAEHGGLARESNFFISLVFFFGGGGGGVGFRVRA